MPKDEHTEEDAVAAALARIEGKLDRASEPPTGFSAAAKLRAAYKRSAQAAERAREDGGDLAARNRAMREANQ